MNITQLLFLITLVTDLILLFLMFMGLFRLGFHERGVFGLGRLLWKQVGHWFSFGFGVVFSIR